METIRKILINGKIKTLNGKNFSYFDVDGKKIDDAANKFYFPVKPRLIACVHLNYKSRLDELKRIQPEAPTYFWKPASCLNYHKESVIRPLGCKFLNYEGEIALVVGKKARNIKYEEAAKYIMGYSIANDFGLHDFRDTDENSMVRVKGSDTLGAVGPDIALNWDYRNKNITTYVNDKIVQKSNTNDMLWSPEYLLADLSKSITFNKGDLILTGTPANSRPVEPGSIVKVEVENLGVLENTIVDGDSLSLGVGAMPKDSHHIRSISLGSDNK